MFLFVCGSLALPLLCDGGDFAGRCKTTFCAFDVLPVGVAELHKRTFRFKRLFRLFCGDGWFLHLDGFAFYMMLNTVLDLAPIMPVPPSLGSRLPSGMREFFTKFITPLALC